MGEDRQGKGFSRRHGGTEKKGQPNDETNQEKNLRASAPPCETKSTEGKIASPQEQRTGVALRAEHGVVPGIRDSFLTNAKRPDPFVGGRHGIRL
jgi:hypothetical protein